MHVRTPLDLGLVIRERRRALGLSQADLALEAGVGRQWLVAVERGKRRAEIGLVLRTLATLDLALAIAPVDRAPEGDLPDIDTVVAAARSTAR